MGSDGALAKVTYLPGVTPPAAPPERTPAEPAPDRTAHDKAARRAENVSMSALTRRGQSRWELRQLLLARDLEPNAVEVELERLEGVGLIDDAALAEVIVRTHRERKGLGRAALIAELRRRRIDQDVIDAAVEHLGADDELERATQLAERRAPQLRNLDHDTAVRRLSGYLQRKGYSGETVRMAIHATLPRQSSGVRFR
ncbi:regulatory protein [Cryobacterium mesophilum]|nr:regulatory protein RecX [Terrimesophilobacter mesophilus]MBB5632150.1 regulatory protein [Terrimesophilobacter mesophilus]